jgi:hypothetical protein
MWRLWLERFRQAGLRSPKFGRVDVDRELACINRGDQLGRPVLDDLLRGSKGVLLSKAGFYSGNLVCLPMFKCRIFDA